MGEKKVPVCVAGDLTPEKVKAYRLADNRSHEEAEWDLEMLGAELFDLKGLGLDLGSTAFDEDELSQLLSPKGLKGADDEVPPAPTEAVTRAATFGCWETTGCSAAIAPRAPTSPRR